MSAKVVLHRERRLPSGMLELRLDLPAAHAATHLARALLRTFAYRHGVRGKELNRLLLVFDEMLSNAVDHGGGAATLELRDAAPGARIGVVLRLDAAHWILDVADRGPGDAASLRRMLRANAEAALDSERGRGLILLRDLADAIGVRQRPLHQGIVVTARRVWHGRKA